MENTIKEQRRQDIIELADKFRRQCPSNVNSMVDWVAEQIYKSKAPRYYISADTAFRNVSKINRGVYEHKTFKKDKLYHDIYKKAIQLQRKSPKRTLMECVIEIIDTQPADSFYLSIHRIKAIIYGK